MASIRRAAREILDGAAGRLVGRLHGGDIGVGADVIGGQIQLLIDTPSSLMPQVRAGKIKALANLSAKRSASMPDIPTADETGVPGLYMSGWFGFFAPKGTPKDVIAMAKEKEARYPSAAVMRLASCSAKYR